MKKSISIVSLLIVYSFFTFGNSKLALEYGKYLPDFYLPLSYPADSKYITYNLPDGKRVIYVAAYESNNFNSLGRQAIKKVLKTERPDICIVIGFEAVEGLSPLRVIEISRNLYRDKKGGESTYAAYFCDKYKIPFMGGEIDDSSLLKGLITCGYSEKDIVLFMLLRQIPYWDRDGDLDEKNPKEQFELFIRKQISGWFKKSYSYSYVEFLNWYENKYKKVYSASDHKWEVALNLAPDRSAGSLWHQKIDADCMNIQDNHILSVIRNSVEKNDKVLVIFDPHQYVWQKKALEAFFGLPIERDLSFVLK